jgi:hypothetical protein
MDKSTTPQPPPKEAIHIRLHGAWLELDRTASGRVILTIADRVQQHTVFLDRDHLEALGAACAVLAGELAR